MAFDQSLSENRKLIDSVPDGWDIKCTRYEWDKISSWVVARYPGIEDVLTAHDVTYGINAAQDILHIIKNDIKHRT